MENATQALFMAAGVLIAVMIISLGVYLFSSTSSIGESYERRMSETEMLKFNNKFEPFNKISKSKDVTITDLEGNEKTLTIYYNYNTISDVVSAINLAMNINEKNNHDSGSGVIVTAQGLGIDLQTDNILNVDLNELLLDYSENKLILVNNSNQRIYKYYFDGEVIQDDTGYVHEIKFTKRSYNDVVWNSL